MIDINAGDELAIAATKTYTAELGAIAMLSAALGNREERKTQLSAIPDAIAATLRMKDEIGRVAPRCGYMELWVVIGRGFNYATAFELSLKLTELTYTVVQPYSSADFLHGPLALSSRDSFLQCTWPKLEITTLTTPVNLAR